MDAVNRQKFTEVIFKNIRDGVVILDRDFRILSANESFHRWGGKSAADVRSRDCREVFHDVGQICPHCAALEIF